MSRCSLHSMSITAYAQKNTIDAVNHVRFLRRVPGRAAVAQPNIDLLNSFNVSGDMQNRSFRTLGAAVLRWRAAMIILPS